MHRGYTVSPGHRSPGSEMAVRFPRAAVCKSTFTSAGFVWCEQSMCACNSCVSAQVLSYVSCWCSLSCWSRISFISENSKKFNTAHRFSPIPHTHHAEVEHSSWWANFSAGPVFIIELPLSDKPGLLYHPYWLCRENDWRLQIEQAAGEPIRQNWTKGLNWRYLWLTALTPGWICVWMGMCVHMCMW